MKLFSDKKIIYISVFVAIVIICTVGIFMVNKTSEDSSFESYESNIVNPENKETEEIEEKIWIYVVGEVNCPGVIEANNGIILKDVIDLAGGFTPSANIEKINLAYRVEDGQKIIIPSIYDNENDEEEALVSYIVTGAGNSIIDGNAQNRRVNINRASQTELETLSGIGPSMASKIIDYRTKNGKFKNVEDLKNVPGIGDAKYEALKDEIII